MNAEEPKSGGRLNGYRALILGIAGRPCNRIIASPTKFYYSMSRPADGDICQCACGGKRHTGSAVGDMKVVASIPALGRSRSPDAIMWTISFFVVSSLKRHSGRLWSHVCKKPREILSPFIAHSDATTTIVFIIGHFWIFAALFGMPPCAIFCCLIGISMSSKFLAQQFLMQATTAFCFSSSERVLSYDEQSAAIALNLPSGITAHSRPSGKNNKSFEALAMQIDSNWHDAILAGVSV